MSDSGLDRCAICTTPVNPSVLHVVCIAVKRGNKVTRYSVTTCNECAASIGNWLLSLPNIPASRTSTSVSIYGANEVLDVPLDRKDLGIIKRWLRIGR